MKFEPFGALLFAASMASVGVGDQDWMLVGMALGGGSLAGVYSVIKGRMLKTPRRDVVLWAYLSAVGGTLLGLAFAEYLAGQSISFGDSNHLTMPPAPPLALVIAASGGTLTEMLVKGWVARKIKKALGEDDRGVVE